MTSARDDIVVQSKKTFRGIRSPVFGESGSILCESNDTPAQRLWNFLERRMLPARSHDIVMNRFPAKLIWDALSLGQILVRSDLSLKQKLGCGKFYRDGGGIDNLLATLTRSGQAWLELTIALALDLARGGDGNYTYRDDVWYLEDGTIFAKLDWRTAIGQKDEVRVFDVGNSVHLHTHHAYYRTRCRRVKGMKVVILVRSILESLESNYFKIARSPNWPDVTTDDEDSFNWERYLDDAIEFYNSWGDVLTWHRSCRLYKYHDVKADPPDVIKEITDFWNLDLPLECIEEALRRTTKKAMAEKIPKEEHDTVTRVSYREDRGVISQPRKAYIFERLNRELIYDLGYDYSDNHEWGKFYD